MPKHVLPASNLRPPISEHLRRHRERLTTLNDFYWGVTAGFHTLAHAAQQGASSTDGFLPSEIGKRWFMPVGEVAAKVATEAMRLRQVIVVQAVTYYEAFLSSLLID